MVSTVFLDHGGEVLFAEFADDVEIVRGLIELEDVENIGMCDGFEGLYLVVEEFFFDFVGDLA